MKIHPLFKETIAFIADRNGVALGVKFREWQAAGCPVVEEGMPTPCLHPEFTHVWKSEYTDMQEKFAAANARIKELKLEHRHCAAPPLHTGGVCAECQRINQIIRNEALEEAAKNGRSSLR